MPETPVHVPVLLKELVEGLAPEPQRDSLWLDGTLGLGGHAQALLEAAGPKARLLGLDKDAEARQLAAERLKKFADRVVLQASGFEEMEKVARPFLKDAPGFDGILLDLGVSSLQLDTAQRGFSFSKDAPLDMRLDQGSGEPASAWLAHQDEQSLARVLRDYGEEPKARAYARSILKARPESTGALAAAVLRAAGPRREHTAHPATRVFQAIRIAVNRELEALEAALPQAERLLKPGGRLAVISFHSLEDRRVKEYFKRQSTDCLCPPRLPQCACGHKASLALVTRKALVPGAQEIGENPRSRSAKLRIARRL